MTYNYLASPEYHDRMAAAAEAAEYEGALAGDTEEGELRGIRFLGERDFDLADLDSWTDWYLDVTGVLR